MRAVGTTRVLNKYHIGDARRLGSLLPQAEFVDTTVTSPPYWNLKDYGSKNQVGFGQTYEEYLSDLRRIFKATFAITKRTGSLWVVADTVKWNGEVKLFPFDLARRLKGIGWVLQDILVWHKDKTLPWSHRGKLRNIFEYVLFFTKGPRFKYYLSRVREIGDSKEWWVRYPERYSPEGKAPTRTWSIPIPRQGSWGDNWVAHFCPFPPEIVRRIVLLTTRTGDVVFDPFAGSGVVLAQARALGRRYVGLDLKRQYRRMFEQKVLPSVMALEGEKSKTHLIREQKRRAHAALIWRLRKTKFPRELVRLYEGEYGRLEARGVVAIAEGAHHLSVVFLFPPRKKQTRDLGHRLNALMSRPPLSKYGLRVNVTSASIDAGLAAKLRRLGLSENSRLSVYAEGRTYRAAARTRLAELPELLERPSPRRKRNRFLVPLIISNVRVSVPAGTR
jgi:DNA modification methylase